MQEDFKALTVVSVESGATIISPTQNLPEKVTLASPAIDVMTDLSRIPAITVGPSETIDEALARMQHSRVHLLLVLGEQDEVSGLISARDIQGERPVRFMREMGVARADVSVRDIMTPRDKLEAIRMHDVAAASVGDIVETLKRTGRHHAMVIEITPDGTLVRGLFSSIQMSSQLGISIEQSGVAGTFSELEAALAH